MADQKPPTKYRIGKLAMFILVFFAILFDVLGMIPFLKDFLATIYWVCAGIYFWKAGMGIFNSRRVAVMAVSWAASMIPVVQEIPIELLAGVIAVIMMSRVEDKTGISLNIGKSPISNAAKSAPPVINSDGKRDPIGPPIPKNHDGVREPQVSSESTPSNQPRREMMNDIKPNEQKNPNAARDNKAQEYGEDLKRIHQEYKDAGMSDEDAQKHAAAEANVQWQKKKYQENNLGYMNKHWGI